jgi:hypothetical protein
MAIPGSRASVSSDQLQSPPALADVLLIFYTFQAPHVKPETSLLHTVCCPLPSSRFRSQFVVDWVRQLCPTSFHL